MFCADKELCDRVVELCQQLIRVDTTNPPGNERLAAELVATELGAAGLEPVVLESAPGRANVVARLTGSGEAPPLLLAAHLDVVPADPSRWRHGPFSGDIADGCLWGRGAVDMKNMAAMCLGLVCRLARERVRLERDVIFAAVADEEAGCRYGSSWLCDEHPDLVRAQYAIGESGGFNIFLGAKRFFTIQVAEKGFCWVRARVRGEPGHGSMPREDSAVVKLAEAVAKLARRGLPPHQTEVVQDFIEAVAEAQSVPVGLLVRAVGASGALPGLLRLVPDKTLARPVAAMLANTACATVVRAGEKTNVIPGVAEMEIDGRTLPGQTDADLLRELGAVLGPGFELEVMRSAPPVEASPWRTPLYERMAQAVLRREPDAAVVPYLLPAFTDAKSFARLGTRWYGFAPLKLPRGMRFADLYHGDDERVPLDGLRWGTEVLAEVVAGFAAAGS